MADADPQFKRLLLPAEETLFEQLLRFGLYLGAVFQIMCLLSIVIYQAGPSDGVAALKVSNQIFLGMQQLFHNNDSCNCRTIRATWSVLRTVLRWRREDLIGRESKRKRKDVKTFYFFSCDDTLIKLLPYFTI